MHNMDPGTNLLERGWVLIHSGGACGEKHQTGVSLPKVSLLGTSALEFGSVDVMVASLQL